MKKVQKAESFDDDDEDDYPRRFVVRNIKINFVLGFVFRVGIFLALVIHDQLSRVSL